MIIIDNHELPAYKPLKISTFDGISSRINAMHALQWENMGIF